MSYDANTLRLPDPNTTPAGPGWNKQNLADVVPGMIHPLNGPTVISVQNGGQYWKIDISYPELTEAEAQELLSFLYSIQGPFTPFYIQLPNLINPATGAWSLSTNDEKGLGNITLGSAKKIVIANASALGGTFTPGDALKLSNTNKIYRIVKVETVSTTLEVTLNCDIQSPSTIDTFTELEPNDVRFRVKLIGNPPTIGLNTSGLIPSISLDMRESI